MGIPNSGVALLPYVENFSNKLVTTPAAYQVTADEATAFAQLVLDYQAAQQALIQSREAGVRSEPMRFARDAARDAMMPSLRSIYGMIQKSIVVTNDAKSAIGVKVPKTTLSPTPAPTVRPKLTIVSVYDRTIETSIVDPTVGSKRSRPRGAAQALVYYFAGENYSSDPNTWQFAGVATERKFSFTVPESVASGTRVWVCAAYTNRKGDPGPTNVPVSTAVQGSGVAASSAANLKIAA